MITIINSNEEIHNLFSNSGLITYKQKDFHFKFPLVIFDGSKDVFNFKSRFLIFSSTSNLSNINESVKSGKGNNNKYLMFDNEIKIIKFYRESNCKETFFGVNLHKLINKNAKIMLFVNALCDTNSNISMLNCDIINYILGFFGPVVYRKK